MKDLLKYSLILFLTALAVKLQSQCSGFNGILEFDDNSAAGHSFCHTSEGGYLFAGVSSNYGSGGTDWILTKLDSDLQIVYSKAIGWPSDESGTNVIVEELSNGEIILAGYRDLGTRVAIITKLSETGDWIWSKEIETISCTPRDIEETSDGEILISGSIQVPASSSTDAFLLKYSIDGSFIWGNRLDSGNGNDHIYGITLDDNDLIYCAGNTQGYAGIYRGYMVKFDPDGNVLLQKAMDSGNFSTLLDIDYTDNGELLASGYELQGGNRIGLVLKTNADFEVIWDKLYEYSPFTTAASLEMDTQGRIIAGFVSGSGNNFIAVAELEENTGNLISSYRTEIGENVEAYFISNVFQSGPAGEVGIMASDDFSFYGFDSCLFSDCQDQANPEVSEANYGDVDYDIPPASLPSIADVTPSVLEIDLEANFLCESALSFDVSISGECVDEEFLFELIEVSDISLVESVEWNISNLGDFTGNPLSIIINESGTYSWQVLVTSTSGNETTLSGEFNVLEAPDPAEIDLPSQIDLCPGEELIIDFTPYLDEWDSVTDMEGEELTTFEASSAGNFVFNFNSVCLSAEQEINITALPDYTIIAPSTACTNSEFEISLSPIVENDLDLSVNFGDQSDSDVFNGQSQSHSYESTGIYEITIEGTVAECDVDLSTMIEVQSAPELNLPDTVYKCFNEPFSLDFTGLGYEVVNESGILINTFETNVSGSFSFTAQNFCGEDEQTVVVIFESISPIQLAAPSVICEGSETLTIGFQDAEYDFLWSDGSQSSSINITAPGIYSVVVSSGESCSSSYSFQISPQEPLNLGQFPDGAVQLCSEGNRTIILPNFGFDYSFPNGEEGQAYEAAESEILPLSFTDGCYDYNVDIEIEVIDCLCPVYIPNAFSPDSDGLNDMFKASANCTLESFHMMIFNRWGNLVFESHDIDTGWNGDSGNDSFHTSSDTYFYLVTYTQRLDGLRIPNEMNGHVTLLR